MKIYFGTSNVFNILSTNVPKFAPTSKTTILSLLEKFSENNFFHQ